MCHLVTVPPGPLLSDALISSPILQGEDGAAPGMEYASEYGFDPNSDPELALVNHRFVFVFFLQLLVTCPNRFSVRSQENGFFFFSAILYRFTWPPLNLHVPESDWHSTNM